MISSGKYEYNIMEMSIEGQEWDHERSYMSYYWVGFHPLVDGELLKKKN